jgi:predicted transglutaminase-like cysteine proteinase
VTVCCGAIFAGSVLFAPSGNSADAEEVFRQSFWDSQEIASYNLRPFWKWRAVFQRYSRETERNLGQACPSSRFGDCHYEDWRRFLEEIRNSDRWGQLIAVNAFMNTRRYMPDERNWGVKDYWATPGEFMARSGDCEDYAIAKYISLKELGWAEGDLRVVVVRDSILKVAHAVLVAFYGGRTWVLDNQTSRVKETVDVRHYQPVFSINETAWWHHRPDNSAQPATATGELTSEATPTAAELPR